MRGTVEIGDAERPNDGRGVPPGYSTVTVFARFRG
jgi:hypothetical protein